VLALDQLYVSGSVIGSVINAGTENITQVVETNISAAGTITGSVVNCTTLGNKGTLTGSFLKGTVDGAYVAATIPASGLKLFSVIGTGITSTNGSIAHGLGATPAFVSIVPTTAFIVGTDSRPPWLGAAVNATHITVVAGTNGTANIYAIA
jgi:hypothetical protein